jgi:hypothetical protein
LGRPRADLHDHLASPPLISHPRENRIRREMTPLDDGAVVVGHSARDDLINVLAERPPEREFRAIVLIAAPSVGADGRRLAQPVCLGGAKHQAHGLLVHVRDVGRCRRLLDTSRSSTWAVADFVVIANDLR